MARKETPLMQQYNKVKAAHPEAVLLFRVGDFYETFGEDAVKAAKVLDIVLTKRGNGSASEIELAGFPHHSLDNYLPRLVRSGLKVAVCDQLEDPKLAKGIVKRGVTELVTPGVAFHDQVLDSRSNNFLAAIHLEKKKCGIAFLDVSTGDFHVGSGDAAWVDRLLEAHGPSEVLYARPAETDVKTLFDVRGVGTRLEDWVFGLDYATEQIQKTYGAGGLKGLGLHDNPQATIAAGALLHYLSVTKNDRLGHLGVIRQLKEDGTLWLDRFTIRNLELLHPSHPDGRALVDVLDKTSSPMGARCLRRWLVMPLTDVGQIENRHAAVETLVNQAAVRQALRMALSSAGDLERLVSKASTGRIQPRELAAMRRGIHVVHEVAAEAAGLDALMPLLEQLSPCEELLERLERDLVPEPAVSVAKGQVIADGVDPELDELRHLQQNAQEALDAICARETERTGISSLKIAFNNVFGYYLEVRHAHKDKVPEDWIRKQTLTQAERYITEELKELEAKILDANDRAESLEGQCYRALVEAVGGQTKPLQKNAQTLAALDVLAGFAELAVQADYNRPEFVEDQGVDIRDGRHPVIEQALPEGERYIANDVRLDPDDAQILMITGPNMAGKSALLRQTALISLLAQIGSFVPAARARLGILDRIFTRVGASDNISSGESTFMVEMNETALILNNLTAQSLVLLDEIGRGTSTYDGVSIAWAIAEHLHSHPQFRPLTLFATHYHELNAMREQFPRIQNANVSVREVDGSIVFLRKLAEGGSNHSFGIHVARLAGMPQSLTRRADEVLAQLEKQRRSSGEAKRVPEPQSLVSESGALVSAADAGVQMSIFQLDDPVLEQVRDVILDLDIDHLTPMEALVKLHEIRKRVAGR
jgi:DNA mismatch repair protein MutS